MVSSLHGFASLLMHFACSLLTGDLKGHVVQQEIASSFCQKGSYFAGTLLSHLWGLFWQVWYLWSAVFTSTSLNGNRYLKSSAFSVFRFCKGRWILSIERPRFLPKWNEATVNLEFWNKTAMFLLLHLLDHCFLSPSNWKLYYAFRAIQQDLWEDGLGDIYFVCSICVLYLHRCKTRCMLSFPCCQKQHLFWSLQTALWGTCPWENTCLQGKGDWFVWLRIDGT